MQQNRPRNPGIGLALSGGGFRAALFHLGSLWRVNELGLLPKLAEVTSVSGGSITAGFLGLRWKQLEFDEAGVAANYREAIVEPLRGFCSRTIDLSSGILGLLSPFHSPSDLLAKHYREGLFGDATLEELPSDAEGPRFTLYATSLQTGVSVRFSRPYLADYLVGRLDDPPISLARVVAASSGFPPVFCPVTFKLHPNDWVRTPGADLYDDKRLRRRLDLADGGIYDNMGLERVWDDYETVLVSDAGAPFSPKPAPRLIRLSMIARAARTLEIIDRQSRALRKRRLISDYVAGKMRGTYWGIATHIEDYRLVENGQAPALVGDNDLTKSLASVRTRLNSFSDQEQGRLINWGYALTDAGLRRWVLPSGAGPGMWPAPEFRLDAES